VKIGRTQSGAAFADDPAARGEATMIVMTVKLLVMTGLTALALAFGLVIITDLSK
jgi:hypothetical protein